MPRTSNLEDHTGYWLRKLSNHVSASFERRLQAHGLSAASWVVLRILHGNDALSLKEIVGRVGVDQGALSRMIERLSSRSLVSRTTSPTSRREVSISLTQEGRRLVPVLAHEADENDKDFFGRLPAKRRAEFEATLHTLLAMNPSSDIPLR
ncbi:MAG TPA: MarR family transcriptional regulator [Opitutaceae bacterium]|jgi:DNA-binding MarR family transcriptional regulator|nr:MarR family transcriptional regulator [Opitutaceae bacterium]